MDTRNTLKNEDYGSTGQMHINHCGYIKYMDKDTCFPNQKVFYKYF